MSGMENNEQNRAFMEVLLEIEIDKGVVRVVQDPQHNKIRYFLRKDDAFGNTFWKQTDNWAAKDGLALREAVATALDGRIVQCSIPDIALRQAATEALKLLGSIYSYKDRPLDFAFDIGWDAIEGISERLKGALG